MRYDPQAIHSSHFADSDSSHLRVVGGRRMLEMRYAQRFVTLAIGLFVLFAMLGLPGMAAADPTIGNITTTPSHLDLSRRTDVTVTAFVNNTDEIFSSSFNLQRLNADGSVTVLGQLKDDGSKGDKVAGDHIYTVVQNFNVAQTGAVRLQIVGNVVLKRDRSTKQVILSDVFELSVGQNVPAGGGGTIPGTGGTSLTIPQGSFTVPIVAAIDAIPSSTIVAPFNTNAGPTQALVAAVEITVEPPQPGVDILPPGQSLHISVPLPAALAQQLAGDTHFLVAEQVLAPSLGTPGLQPRLRVAAAAVLVGTNIVTQAAADNPLPGILHSGIYALVTARGSGYVTGVASEASGPVQGAIISSNTNAVIAATNGTGTYSIFVSGGPFTVSAFNPFRGTTGSATGTIVTDGSTVQVNITLAPLTTPPVSLDGIRNSGFENCSLPGADVTGGLTGTWGFTGNSKAITQLTTLGTPTANPPIPPRTILPREGSCMLDISTGVGTQNLSSSAGQRFVVPAGARTLSFEFTFISEEFPEFVGTQFNDIFKASITVNGQQTIFTGGQVQVNDFVNGGGGGFTEIGDCFPNAPFEGDNTCGEINDSTGQPGWRTATIDLSNVAAVGTPTTVDLLFTVNDAGDNIYDTHVLIDNIRFGTIWADAKIVQGANADVTRVKNDIRSANDVLSQAGLIVRLRNPQPTLFTNAALLDPDITYTTATTGTCANQSQLNGQPSSEETSLTAQSRSPVNTDINVYYARTAFRDGALNTGYVGYAIGPDEFCNGIDINASSGMILFDGANSTLRAGVPGHEMGHLLIAPDNAFATTEHGTSDSLNFMWGTNTPVNGLMTRQQSFEINRPTNYPGAVNRLIVP